METITEPETPEVVQNSDVIYRKDIEWVKDIEYQEPNDFEKDMLKDTKTPDQLIDDEKQEEEIVLMSEEDKQTQKKKNLLLMFKIISANRLNLHPLYNLSTLQPFQKEKFKNHMESLIEDYNNGFEEDITKQFNEICNEKLFSCGADVSSYPIYT